MCGGNFMVQKTKVDICGIDTTKLPVLKHKEITDLLLKNAKW